MSASVLIDVVVVLLLIGAAIAGWRSGLLRSVFSAVGLIAGGVAAYLLIPVLATRAPTPDWRPVFVIGGGLVLLVVGQTIGALLGRLLSRGMRAIHLSAIDRAAGLAISTVVVALVLGTVAGGVAGFGAPVVSQAVAGSATLGTIDRLTPDPAKAFLASVRASAVNDAVPWVLENIAPPTTLPPVAKVDTSSPALTTAGASVVRVSGNAYRCGVGITGSGFVIADDRIITNAHVVAGVTDPVVEAPGEQPRGATVVYFDPATDLAVLDVPGLEAPALRLGNTLSAGSGAAVQGYPFGGPFVSLPATVADTVTIPDTTGSSSREVYTLAATINQGDSGGPLLSPDGAAAGVVFAKSANAGGVGYALTLSELAPVVARAPSLSATVSSGACAA